MADNLTKEQRSYCMSRVRSRDTGPELLLRRELHRLGYRFRKHSAALPGKPDIVFTGRRIAIFVDGDFWHGFRFPRWRDSLAPFWQEKIEKNRSRDQRTFRRLRQAGWHVVRVWQHQIDGDLSSVLARLVNVLKTREDYTRT
jgi:DNA mismatch endonuclease (patch repair protein)